MRNLLRTISALTVIISTSLFSYADNHESNGSVIITKQEVQATVVSQTQQDSCINITPWTPLVFEVFPNDEAITGVSSTKPAWPFTFGTP